MKEVPQSPACDQKIDRYPPFQKAAGLRRANQSCWVKSSPPHSQFLAKLLTSAPVNFYLRTAEVRIEILHGLGRFLRLVARCFRGFKLHSNVRVTAVAQLVREEPE